MTVLEFVARHSDYPAAGGDMEHDISFAKWQQASEGAVDWIADKS